MRHIRAFQLALLAIALLAVVLVASKPGALELLAKVAPGAAIAGAVFLAGCALVGGAAVVASRAWRRHGR